MSLKTAIAKIWAKKRAKAIYRLQADPVHSQKETLKRLTATAKDTRFGKHHSFAAIRNEDDFKKAVPIRDYEAAKDYFDRIRKGEEDVNWPGKPLYLAKTSGTTSGAKYIPITKQSIRFQISAARDALFHYINASGSASFLDGKMMFLSGSPTLEENEYGIKVGRLSGIVNHWIPSYLTRNRVPGYETNCIEDWETKVDTIINEIKDMDLRLISGIPPWVQMLFEKLEEKTGKMPLEAWPNLSIFAQGGVDFTPYRDIFDKYFQDKVTIWETFPASEGFFAVQDSMQEGMLLNLNMGLYYEFIPVEHYHDDNPPRLNLGQVEVGKQYALVISSNAGLWAYNVGDTVRFVSKNPWRLKVSGRIKHFISAFGEHVISEEVSKAMAQACRTSGANIQEFTVAPFISEIKGESFHEWWVEFTREPENLDTFALTLDRELCGLNSYYRDLRDGNMLRPAQVRTVKLNASREYMRSIGKLGGQNKFPRLSNDRTIANVLAAYLKD